MATFRAILHQCALGQVCLFQSLKMSHPSIPDIRRSIKKCVEKIPGVASGTLFGVTKGSDRHYKAINRFLIRVQLQASNMSQDGNASRLARAHPPETVCPKMLRKS